MYDTGHSSVRLPSSKKRPSRGDYREGRLMFALLPTQQGPKKSATTHSTNQPGDNPARTTPAEERAILWITLIRPRNFSKPFFQII
jgi:hypothetical protein